MVIEILWNSMKHVPKYKYGFKLSLDKPREEQVTVKIPFKPRNMARIEFISRIMDQHKARIEKRGSKSPIPGK
jgi:hypothetical protein